VCEKYRKTARERERQKERERESKIEIERERKKETHREKDTEREKERERCQKEKGSERDIALVQEETHRSRRQHCNTLQHTATHYNTPERRLTCV